MTNREGWERERESRKSVQLTCFDDETLPSCKISQIYLIMNKFFFHLTFVKMKLFHQRNSNNLRLLTFRVLFVWVPIRVQNLFSGSIILIILRFDLITPNKEKKVRKVKQFLD